MGCPWSPCPDTVQRAASPPLKIVPSHEGIWTPWFLGLIRAHNTNGISIGSIDFCTANRRVSIYFTMGRPFPPLKLAHSRGGYGPRSNIWFHGPTRLYNPNGISIGSADFAGLTSVTDRPTDHATWSVTIGRIYVRSTAMRPIIYIAIYGRPM